MITFTNVCSSHCFAIPINQRGFSWGRNEVDYIFNDLELAGTYSHYMGTLIVSRTERPDFQDDTFISTTEFLIEDGQQRLTTFFIILNEIMKRIKLLNANQPNPITNKIEELLFYNKNGKKLRIKNDNNNLNAGLLQIFFNQSHPITNCPPIVALNKAAKHIENKLSNCDDQKLANLMNKLINKAKFVWVDLNSQSMNRYLTFDAINSRGLPLSEFDKIKNFCILIDHTHALNTTPEDSWYNAITSLETYKVSSRNQEAAFIRDLYNVFHGVNVSQENVHEQLVKKYGILLKSKNQQLEIKFRKFIDIWHKYALSFGYISTPDKTSTHPEWLIKLDNMDLPTIMRPLLTVSYMMYNQNDFKKICKACEIYTFRVHAVMRYRKDNNANQIIKLSKKVLLNNLPCCDVLSIICSWLDKFAPLKDVILKLADGEPKYYFDSNVKGWQHCYYFLYEYELYNSPQGVSPLSWGINKADKINSQEHILPQDHRDGGWWENHWPNENQANKHKHRLGNLVLTAQNSELGRKPFHDKLSLFSGNNATNSEKVVHKYSPIGTLWLEKNILNREKDMLHFAAKRWSIPCCFDNSIILLENHKDDQGHSQKIDVQNTDCIEVNAQTMNNYDELEVNNDMANGESEIDVSDIKI